MKCRPWVETTKDFRTDGLELTNVPPSIWPLEHSIPWKKEEQKALVQKKICGADLWMLLFRRVPILKSTMDDPIEILFANRLKVISQHTWIWKKKKLLLCLLSDRAQCHYLKILGLRTLDCCTNVFQPACVHATICPLLCPLQCAQVRNCNQNLIL